MNNKQKEVIQRANYFIINYLPWILLLFAITGISICVYHYNNKSCLFEKEKEDKNNLYEILNKN